MRDVEKAVQTATVTSIDYEGRGVARVDGKAVFIRGALPSEKVCYRVTRSKKQFDEAEVVEIEQASSERIRPECRYFETCGGCVLQHVRPQAQVAFKQRIMEEQLERIGKVKPSQILPPIYGMPWHYRDRARLSVSVNQKGRLKMGFQAKKTHDVVDIASCGILPRHVSLLLPEVKKLLQQLAAEGATAKFVEFFSSKQLTVMNLGFQKRPSETHLTALKRWFDTTLKAQPEQWQVWLQEGWQSHPFYPEGKLGLTYDLSEFNVHMPYRPGDFTQINAEMNNVMVGRALKLLDIRSGERIADLFCGLGNFSLPMAKCGAEVVGIEGSETLVVRAHQNARENLCAEQTTFLTADLFDTDETVVTSWGKFDKMLLDPPRSGAYAVVKSLYKPYLPQRIVYVSCNPATFARDAAVLVEKGYAFQAAGVMNMFAQTAHVESIGVFELQNDTNGAEYDGF
ncbi:23S rRNA (uracil(1939)-C(5))-methyltransferase RlmD [Neisseria perflava]|uniref:23S rRNA (uracil(1939)-C(5))-methyltransferase RlmD n=1 Tax=Neisseria perflava TaxID=33053 RepID=UPI0020A1B46B|nr:23S rRNA (uracil(1939)-C(5))-methyltransferase RlmD [Neisseria perflava]